MTWRERFLTPLQSRLPRALDPWGCQWKKWELWYSKSTVHCHCCILLWDGGREGREKEAVSTISSTWSPTVWTLLCPRHDKIHSQCHGHNMEWISRGCLSHSPHTTTGLATCRGILRGTDKILATLLAASPCVVVKGRAKEQTPLRSCIGALECSFYSRGSPCVCSPTALLVASETWFVIKQKH